MENTMRGIELQVIHVAVALLKKLVLFRSGGQCCGGKQDKGAKYHKCSEELADLIPRLLYHDFDSGCYVAHVL